MDHLIGQRFSLISKSEIRYVGTLHEINAEQSTIALENVFSFGTEDRQVASYIPPSQQKFEYIVFRGSDVKDIKIDEEPRESVQASQPPNDPAILNSSRPAPSHPAPQPPPPPSNRGESPFPPQNYPPPGQYGGFYPPPPPGQFGRGYGPPPGNFGPPGPGFPPYGPPPGYFGPPGQGFPQGPNRFPQQPPAPIGPPGQRPLPPAQHPPPPGPISAPVQTPELPVEKAAPTNGSKAPTPAPAPVPAPGPGVTHAEPPKAVDAPPPTLSETAQPPPAAKPPPTQPKGNRVTPAMPFAVNQKSFTPPVSTVPTSVDSAPKPAPSKAVQSLAEMEEASRQAKEAVATAMAKINAQSTPKPASQAPPTVDTITEQFSQTMTSSFVPRGRGQYRGGRGARASSGGHRQKMEIPQSDFDFESANAKFNKEDMIKEAIASGSPLGEGPDTPLSGGIEEQINGTNGAPRKDSVPLNPVSAYNKSTSFFDNISSEAKDREDVSDGKMNARALRGQEFKKNVETFGQGNVDSGYRGRGRGGYRGRGRGDYNRGSNYRGGYRSRGRCAANPAEATQN